MKAINLFWTIIWGIVLVTAVVGIWFNWVHILTTVIAAVFFSLFLHDYIKEAKRK